MSIKNGSMQLTFFHVADPVTEDFWGYVAEHITQGAFKPVGTEDVVSAGFASWEDLFDCSFSKGYQKDEYIVFQFRIDKRKIAPMLLKQHIQQSISAYKQEKGHFPSKKEREIIKESVKEDLLHKTMPCPSGFEVVWNHSSNLLILGTTSPKLIETFLERFEAVFRLYPRPLYHLQWALHMQNISNTIKDSLSRLLNPSSPQALQEGRFLGYEFLTWLWFTTETQDNTGFYLGDKVILSNPSDGRERIICNSTSHNLREAKTALAQGKMVEEAQWILQKGDHEYSFTLDVSLWTMKNFKTPYSRNDGDDDSVFLERMFFLEEVRSFIEDLYRQFLMTRFDSRWQSDVTPLMAEWVKNNIRT